MPEQYQTILAAKQRQIESLQAQLQDYNAACQRLENALIQEQLRTKQLIDDIGSYKAMLTLKDTQLDELHLRFNQSRPPSSPASIPGLMGTEKEVILVPHSSFERTVSANAYDYSDKEVLITKGLNVPSPSPGRMANRSHSFSDKLPVTNHEKHLSRASSAITFDALGVPAVLKTRNSAAELKEPKGYSSKPSLRYYGRNEGG